MLSPVFFLSLSPFSGRGGYATSRSAFPHLLQIWLFQPRKVPRSVFFLDRIRVPPFPHGFFRTFGIFLSALFPFGFSFLGFRGDSRLLLFSTPQLPSYVCIVRIEFFPPPNFPPSPPIHCGFRTFLFLFILTSRLSVC